MLRRVRVLPLSDQEWGFRVCTSAKDVDVLWIRPVSLIIGLIITGLVITLGGGPDRTRRGSQYWNNPGAIARAGLVDNVSADRFLAILSVIVQAAFSFQGLELIAVYGIERASQEIVMADRLIPSAASETESPRRNISKAVKRVFWRILIFYVRPRAICLHLHLTYGLAPRFSAS